MEELKNREEINITSDEDEYLSDIEDENNIIKQEKNFIENSNKIKNVIIIKKYKVKFYFDFNKNKKITIPINTDNFNINESYGYDLIKNIIKKINSSNFIIKDDKNIKYTISLKDIDDDDNIDFYINNYEIKPFESWKKKDNTNYCSKSLLKSFYDENISFYSKNPLNIMLMKQF